MQGILDKYRPLFLTAYRIRVVEKKLLQLFKGGKVHGTIHTCIGQEFSAVFVAKHLREDDVVFSNHRCHGHYIAKTGDVRGLIAEILGKAGGACRGLGGSQHLCNRSFFSNGIQGGIVPVSAGIGLHHKLQRNGSVAVVYLGDGTFGEGVVYEALNLVALWSIPLLVVVEDNMYAQSTASRQAFAGTFAGRAAAFGVAYHEASIWDLDALDATVAAAVSEVREQCKPAVLCIRMYRLEAHSKGDDDRDPIEIAGYRSKDPLTKFLTDARECARTQSELARIEGEIDEHIAEVAAQASFDLRLPVQLGAVPAPQEHLVEPENLPQAKAINAALDAFLAAVPNAVLLGEDIHSPYGGAFKVTKDLSTKHPQQVYTTPISEACIVGVANGLALMGRRVVVEIMFGDFITLAFDQLVNHAAKFGQMYGGGRSMPVIVRSPMGGGRGYGPTHSQSLEKHLAGVAGTSLFVLHGRANVQHFYRALLFHTDVPSIVIENKTLYAKAASQHWPANYALYETKEPFPVSILRLPGEPDITLVALGAMSALAERVAVQLHEEDEICVELILPLRVYPLDVAVVLKSLRRTRRLVVVEEGTHGFDLGAEIVASIAECWHDARPFRVRRLAAKDMILPSALSLEAEVLPSAPELHRLCLEIFSG